MVTGQLDTRRADPTSAEPVPGFPLPAPSPSLRETALRVPKHLARVHEVHDEEGNEHRQGIQTQLVGFMSQDRVRRRDAAAELDEAEDDSDLPRVKSHSL